MEYRHTHGGARIAAESSRTASTASSFIGFQFDQGTACWRRWKLCRACRLTSDEFTLTGGEITPTLKLKRRVIEAKYKQQIEALYQQPY
jgi:long-subunit acyl-CoA synthetase (AMP-forming)